MSVSINYVPLREIADVIRGVTYSSGEAVNQSQSGYVPVLRAGNIQGELELHDELVWVPSERMSTDQRIRKNDIVMCTSSGSVEVVGKTARARSDWEGSYGAFCAGIRARPQVADAAFLHHFLGSPIFKAWARRSSGANIKNIRKSELEEFKVPVLPFAEQKRIAAILDKADAIRRKRKEAIQLADEFLRSVFLDMYGDPINNPKGWPVFPMGKVIDFKGGNQPAKSTFIYEPKDGYVRLIQIRDFKSDKYPTYIPLKLARRMFNRDDVMIARYGPPVFQILRGLEGSYNVALMKADPQGAITKDFIFHLLQTPRLHGYVVSNSERTAGQTGVNLNLLNNYKLPLPPLGVQAAITERMRRMERIIERCFSHQKSSNDLMGSLQQRAFRGEL